MVGYAKVISFVGDYREKWWFYTFYDYFVEICRYFKALDREWMLDIFKNFFVKIGLRNNVRRF